MILSGIFGQARENPVLFDKLQSLTGVYITQGAQVFKNKFVNMVGGKTSLLNDQGDILTTPAAVLAGKVFSKSTYQPITIDNLRYAAKESLQSFTDKYWGNYLFVHTDERTGSVTILRDPVGQLPLFYTQLPEGEVLFSSELSVLYKMLNKKPSFNWVYFSRYLLQSHVTSEFTAFEGIFELPHGCQLTLSKSQKGCLTEISLGWNPVHYCQNYKQYRGLEYKKKEIIETIPNVMQSWIGGSEAIFLDLSGGLDSSALLLFLSQIVQPAQTLEAINTFHPESGDERKYARRVTQEAQTKLIEFDVSNSLVFSSFPKIPNFYPNWPFPRLGQLKMQDDVNTLFTGHNNFTHISGHGGDHIFSAPPIVNSLADYLIEVGSRGFTGKLKEISTIYRRPVWPILKEVAQGMGRHTIGLPYRSNDQAFQQAQIAPFFAKDILDLERRVRPHPFFAEAKSKEILPGKFALIDTIYSGLSSIKGNIRGNHHSMFYPLLSQPLLELALSLPTYEAYQQDYNRFPFRKAVSDHFKTELVWRKDKGETTGAVQRSFQQNESYILGLCLEGKISQQGFVHKDLLYDSIKNIVMGQTDHMWAITNLVSAEIFMEYWS